MPKNLYLLRYYQGLRLLGFRKNQMQYKIIDNICKAVFDAMNGAVWKDDSQVIRLSAMKFYHLTEGPGLSVHIINEDQTDALDEKPLRELLRMKEEAMKAEEDEYD